MRFRDFLPISFVILIFVVFTTTPVSYAQEEVLPDTLEVEEEIILEEEMIEEAIPEEEIFEEEFIPEEEIIEEEVAPEEEVVEEEAVEEVVEEPSMFKPGWTAKVYVNFGPIEPWGDPGTGAAFNMGFKGQLGAQLNIANWLSLPTVLKPLTAEVMAGYTMFNVKSDVGENAYWKDAKTTLMSGVLLGRYDFTDLILQLIGFEYPAIGIFGVAGFQFNSQSWDMPGSGREFDPATSFGLNLGIGVKYNLMQMVGKPVEIDLRFTQGVFIMGDVKDQDGEPFYPNDDYKHTENGLLLGIAYPF